MWIFGAHPYILLQAENSSENSRRVEEDEENNFESTQIKSCCRACFSTYRYGQCWMTINIILSIVSLTIIAAWIYGGLHPNVRRSSYPSAMVDKLTLSTHVQQIEGGLFPPKLPSIGRAFPNPESDRLWEEIELTRTIVISEEDVRKLGKDPKTTAQFEDKYWGLGEGKYMGQIDAFHQLHCLNSLRKLGYPEYYVNETGTKDEMWYVHHNHCVDILLQNLMCSANVDIITLNWMETQDHPFPDFSINHQCRDFNALLQWRIENSDMKKWNNMVKPVGVQEIPAPKEYYELFGKNGKKQSLVHGYEVKHKLRT